MGEAEAAQGAKQHIGYRREPRAGSVGAHAVRRGAIGARVELTLLDAVLHFAALAADVFVQAPGVMRAGDKRGDAEKRGLALPRVLPPWRRPGVRGSDCRVWTA